MVDRSTPDADVDSYSLDLFEAYVPVQLRPSCSVNGSHVAAFSRLLQSPAVCASPTTAAALIHLSDRGQTGVCEELTALQNCSTRAALSVSSLRENPHNLLAHNLPGRRPLQLCLRHIRIDKMFYLLRSGP